MIRFRCECGKKLKATEDIVGRKVRCTRCEKINTVPATTQLPASQAKSSPPVSANPLGEEPLASEPVSLIPPAADESVMPAAEEPANPRFKAAPEHDPQPNRDGPVEASAATPQAAPSFDFDLDHIDMESTEPTPTEDESLSINTEIAAPFKLKQRPLIRSSWVLVAGIAGVVLSLGGLGIWLWMSQPSTYPTSFEEMQEVKHFRNSWLKFSNSDRKLKVMADAYLALPDATEEEKASISSFDAELSELRDGEAVLRSALELIKQKQVNPAKTLLVETAQKMLDKRPEIDERTVKYAKLGRQ